MEFEMKVSRPGKVIVLFVCFFFLGGGGGGCLFVCVSEIMEKSWNSQKRNFYSNSRKTCYIHFTKYFV